MTGCASWIFGVILAVALGLTLIVAFRPGGGTQCARCHRRMSETGYNTQVWECPECGARCDVYGGALEAFR